MNARMIASQMKVTCRPAVLSQALQIVSRAISSRTTLPILNNILIETTSEGLALTATNLEIGIRKLVPAEVSMEGATTAPARLLTDFVSTLPDQDLDEHRALVVPPAPHAITAVSVLLAVTLSDTRVAVKVNVSDSVTPLCMLVPAGRTRLHEVPVLEVRVPPAVPAPLG